MKISKITFAFVLIVLSLVFITSCTTFETPDGDLYICEDPYMKIYIGTQQEISIIEHNSEFIKAEFLLDFGGGFCFHKYIGSQYVPDLGGVYILSGGDEILSGIAKADNENSLLYLYPDKKEYPDFEDVYVLKKADI